MNPAAVSPTVSNSSTQPKVDVLLLLARLLLDGLLRLLLCCLELPLVVARLLLLVISPALLSLLLVVVALAVLLSGVDVSPSVLLVPLLLHDDPDLSDCVSHCLNQGLLDLSELLLSHGVGLLLC